MMGMNVAMTLGRGIIACSFLGGLSVLMSLSMPLFASADESQKEIAGHQVESREFSKPFGDAVSAVQSLINAGEFAQGIADLEVVLKIENGSPYEMSISYQILGNAYYNLNNYDAAIESFETAIAAGGLSPNEASTLRLNIAQLLIGNDQFVRGAEMLEQWERDGEVLKLAHISMLYQAWLQAEEYEKALPWAKLWFDTANPKKREYYDLINYLYHTLKMPTEQEAILKQMINVWPEDKELWSAWTVLLIQTWRERDAFEVTKMMYLKGLYTGEAEIYKLVEYYVFYDMPYQAAEILEAEIKAGRIRDTETSQRKLEELWRQAREEQGAIRALEKTVQHLEAVFGDKSSSDDLWILARAELSLGRCEKVQILLDKLGPQSVSMSNELHMLVGSCYYDSIDVKTKKKCLHTDEGKRQARETNWRLAKKSFLTVAQTKTVPANKLQKDAQKWVSFIDAEREALDYKCNAYSPTTNDRCFIAIKQAYANMVFAGKFILENKVCQQYVSEYDSLYRTMAK